MADVKDIFAEFDVSGQTAEQAVEVYADSLSQALELASKELGVDISLLDYDILEKGTSGLLGFGRHPYRVLVSPLADRKEYDDLAVLEQKLSREYTPQVSVKEKANVDGTYKIRVTKSGIWLTVTATTGQGRKVTVDEINSKLFAMKITPSDPGKIEKEAAKVSGKPIRIGPWKSNPEYDGSMTVEVAEDEMNVYCHFVPPRFYGKHLEYDDVIDMLKKNDVKVGIREKEIKEYLEQMDYTRPLHAAEGARPINGKDAYIEYKVRVENKTVSFEEDESGKVDFRNLELLENVVVGQLLAVKVPAEPGVPGRTIRNKILPTKSGKDIKILHGKGTILSEEGTELTAEINGQVVFKAGRLSIEPVYIVNGDVSLETGNIIFLGSVIVAGNVQDNFEVKAAGNVEVRGTVQKAYIEAEGDIIVFQGISGREEAKIESTGGSVFAKFIQNSTVFAENDVIVPEGVLHSNVDAGNRICSTGKRARIVGGVIRAGYEVNARYLGADVSTKTEIRVGIHPKILQQLTDLIGMRAKMEEEQIQLKLNLRTLETQKRNAGKMPPDKEKLLKDLTARNAKLDERLEEVKAEQEEMNSYIGMMEHKGKVCAERTAYNGVEIYIKDKSFLLKDPYNHVKFSLEGGQIRISQYEPPVGVESRLLMVRRKR